MFVSRSHAAKRREIFRLERHLGNWIACIRIESGGNEQQVGLEGHELIERAAHLRHMVRTRREGGDGKIMNVPKRTRPCSRIARELVNGRKHDPRIVGDNIFGSVAMVCVEIPNGHPLCPVRKRIERGERNMTEITKPHGAIAHRVVPRRTHETKRQLAVHCRAGDVHRRARSPGRMFVDSRVGGRIRVEIMRRSANPREMLTRVAAQ